MERYKHRETVPPGRVPATQLICIRESDGELVRMIDVRHMLSDYLRDFGGHIGYSVRPSERRADGRSCEMAAFMRRLSGNHGRMYYWKNTGYMSKHFKVSSLDLYEREISSVQTASCEPKEALWAKLPSYYVGGSFVRLIPFKDHINIEAQAVIQHKGELTGHKITPRGMLQIYLTQDIPYEVLKQIFIETLE